MYPAAAYNSYNFFRHSANAIKFIGASYPIWIEGDYSYPVGEEASIDNFGYFDREFGLLDKDLFGYLVLKLCY